MKRLILFLVLATSAIHPLRAITGVMTPSEAYAAFRNAFDNPNLAFFRIIVVRETKETVFVQYAIPKVPMKLEATPMGVFHSCHLVGINLQNLSNHSDERQGRACSLWGVPTTVPPGQIRVALPEPGILQIRFPKPTVRCTAVYPDSDPNKVCFGQSLVSETLDSVVVQFAAGVVHDIRAADLSIRGVDGYLYAFVCQPRDDDSGLVDESRFYIPPLPCLVDQEQAKFEITDIHTLQVTFPKAKAAFAVRQGCLLL